jgi:indole-3-glycerol phosphate synthase
MNILGEITAFKRKETKLNAEKVPVGVLREKDYFARNTLSLTEYLLDSNRTGIIAEFKRRSPSRGIINAGVSVENVTRGYSMSGASAISVLTDTKYFGGSSSDLTGARDCNDIPVLRKDFIISEYQVLETKAIGADAILLIAEILDETTLCDLARLAQSLGLEVLMEVHSARELDKINDYVDIIGVNNRNLDTFEVDISTSLELADRIPDDFVKITESGISSAETISLLKDAGYQGFLIGERFMSSKDPVMAFKEFVNGLK